MKQWGDIESTVLVGILFLVVIIISALIQNRYGTIQTGQDGSAATISQAKI